MMLQIGDFYFGAWQLQLAQTRLTATGIGWILASGVIDKPKLGFVDERCN